jgi:hypothetical protein
MISAYDHGRNAAQYGRHIQACPFDTGTFEWRAWRKGFCDESSSEELRGSRRHLFIFGFIAQELVKGEDLSFRSGSCALGSQLRVRSLLW